MKNIEFINLKWISESLMNGGVLKVIVIFDVMLCFVSNFFDLIYCCFLVIFLYNRCCGL